MVGNLSAGAPSTGAGADDLRDAIVAALSNHRMVNIFEMEEGGPGSNYPLIDHLALDGAADLKSGKEEIEAIADAVMDAIEACAGRLTP